MDFSTLIAFFIISSRFSSSYPFCLPWKEEKETNTNAISQAPAPQTPPNPQKPITKYLIHLSGTGILSDYRSTDPSAPPPGTLNPRVYSDVSLADNTAIFLPPPPPNDGRSSDWIDPLHGETERIVYEAWRREEEEAKEAKANGDGAAAAVRVRTAIMRPPDIYGRGLGVARKTSAYVPFYVREILQGDSSDGEGIGAAFFVGEGQNRRGWVHLEDLMGLYLKLVERAVEGGDEGAAAWGREVSFFFFFLAFGGCACRLGR